MSKSKLAGDEVYVRGIPCLIGGASHRVKIGTDHCWLCGVIIPALPTNNRRREARKKSSGTQGTRSTLAQRDGSLCYYCGTGLIVKPEFGFEDTVGVATIDHRLPKSRGGTNHLDNLVLACGPCNRAKQDRTLEEWRRAGFPGRRQLRAGQHVPVELEYTT